MKFLPLYYKWIEYDFLSGSGLCASLREEGFDYKLLDNEFFTETDDPFEFWRTSIPFEFNGVRQNIILLLAAMNGEL